MIEGLCCKRRLSPEEKLISHLKIIHSSKYSSENVSTAMKGIKQLLNSKSVNLSETQEHAVTKLQKIFDEKQNAAHNSIKRNLAIGCVADDGCLLRACPTDKSGFVLLALNMAGAAGGYLYSDANPDFIGESYPSYVRNLSGLALGLFVSVLSTCILPMCIVNTRRFNFEKVPHSFEDQEHAQDTIIDAGKNALDSFNVDSQV